MRVAGVQTMDERVKFRPLSLEEFQRLSLEERMSYLQRAMAELQAKLEETRKQAERMRPKDE
jgi:uncharacterized protein YydD (DUF2326 family)